MESISRSHAPSISLVGLLLYLLSSFHSADGIAVMSVDLGSEWMKIGIVSVRRAAQPILRNFFESGLCFTYSSQEFRWK